MTDWTDAMRRDGFRTIRHPLYDTFYADVLAVSGDGRDFVISWGFDGYNSRTTRGALVFNRDRAERMRDDLVAILEEPPR